MNGKNEVRARPRLDPAVAAVRHAVRSALLDHLAPSVASPRDLHDQAGADATTPGELRRPGGPLILVGCSGGADSLALAAAAAFVAPRIGMRAGLITVDHQLQPDSAERAQAVAAWARTAGLAPVIVSTVAVGHAGGPEAAARQARYAALAAAAREHGAGAVLIGHTRDDQAETVLLALARGAGPRGLAAMPGERAMQGVRLLRPLLHVDRGICRQACAALNLEPWSDPHNTDPAYARARVRSHALPVLVEALGAAVVSNLATSAQLIAADTEYLDQLAEEALLGCRVGDGLDVAALAALPAAIRTRVLHGWSVELGAHRAALSHRHIAALDGLVSRWHGQGPTMLPGGIRVWRRQAVLHAEG